MDSRKIVWKETAIVAAGELIGAAIMVAIFAAVDRFQMNVLWSALTGSMIMIVNYFFMAVTVSLAADRAADGQLEQGQKLIKLSSTVRLLAMAAALVLGIKLGGNVIALALPLAFARPVLLLAEFFRKKGD